MPGAWFEPATRYSLRRHTTETRRLEGVWRPLTWLAERIENIVSDRFSAVVPAPQALAAGFATINGNAALVQNSPLPGEMSSQTMVA